MMVFGQIAEIFDDGQMVVASPLRRGIVGLLAARAFPAAAGGRGCLRTFFLLRLFAEEIMFQLFDFPLKFPVLLLQFGFSLFATLELGFPKSGLLSLLEQLQH